MKRRDIFIIITNTFVDVWDCTLKVVPLCTCTEQKTFFSRLLRCVHKYRFTPPRLKFLEALDSLCFKGFQITYTQKEIVTVLRHQPLFFCSAKMSWMWPVSAVGVLRLHNGHQVQFAKHKSLKLITLCVSWGQFLGLWHAYAAGDCILQLEKMEDCSGARRDGAIFGFLTCWDSVDGSHSFGISLKPANKNAREISHYQLNEEFSVGGRKKQRWKQERCVALLVTVLRDVSPLFCSRFSFRIFIELWNRWTVS